MLRYPTNTWACSSLSGPLRETPQVDHLLGFTTRRCFTGLQLRSPHQPQFTEFVTERKSESVSHSGVSDSLWPHGLWPYQAPLSMDSPYKNTGVGCHALLQGIFLTQRLTLGLLHGRQSLYCLSHKGSRLIKVACCWVTITFAVAWKAKVLVGQSCLPLCDSMVCSPPGPSDHGILQAKIPEWVAIPFSRADCQPGAWTQVPYVAGRFFILWATREAHYCCLVPANVGYDPASKLQCGFLTTRWIYQLGVYTRIL